MKRDDKSQSLATEAYPIVRQRILRGELATGEIISRRHQQFSKILIAGDPIAASEAMRDHIVSSRERTLARLEPYFEMGRQKGATYPRTRKDGDGGLEAVA